MGNDSNGALGADKGKGAAKGGTGAKRRVVDRAKGRRDKTAAKESSLLKKLERATNVQELLAASEVNVAFENAMAERDLMDGVIIIGYRNDGGYKFWQSGLTTSQILAIIEKVKFGELLDFFNQSEEE